MEWSDVPKPVDDGREAARRAGLRYVSDEEPGITRRGRGKGFSYYDPGGELVRDPDERDRLNALAIPPAWTDVWICPDPTGEAGDKRAVDSADVNAYLREIAGEDFTAKDFRTWAGTIEMAAALLDGQRCENEVDSKTRMAEAVDGVAERLGNTAAVCRECYIHPEIVERYLDGTLARCLDPGANGFQKIHGLGVGESAVLALLERPSNASRSPSRASGPPGARGRPAGRAA